MVDRGQCQKDLGSSLDTGTKWLCDTGRPRQLSKIMNPRTGAKWHWQREIPLYTEEENEAQRN